MTLSSSEIRAILRAHDLHPRRSLGQNFVTDPNTVRRIVRLAGIATPAPAGLRVVEVGAGLGSLTRALAETGVEVVAVEVDPNLVPIVRALLAAHDRVEVIEADALTLDWAALVADRPGALEWRVVANLPYNVATPIVMRVLETAPQIASLLVMVQREVAERMAARPRDPAYGAVSARLAYFADVKIVGRVPPTVFVPEPRVESSLVAMVRREVPTSCRAVPYARVSQVIRAGFATRRKMLRRALDGVVAPEAFAAAGVAPEARAEELGIDEWGRLAGWGQ